MKLINNFLCGVQIASLAEGLVWLERSGIDRHKALAILKNGAPGKSSPGKYLNPHGQPRLQCEFLLKLMSKICNTRTRLLRRTVSSWTTAANARDLFESAARLGFAEQDMSSVVEPLRATSHKTK